MPCITVPALWSLCLIQTGGIGMASLNFHYKAGNPLSSFSIQEVKLLRSRLQSTQSPTRALGLLLCSSLFFVLSNWWDLSKLVFMPSPQFPALIHCGSIIRFFYPLNAELGRDAHAYRELLWAVYGYLALFILFLITVREEVKIQWSQWYRHVLCLMQ